MSLEKITAQIKTQGKKIPPVELWDPEYCGEMDLQIKTNGDWFYAGTIFKRPALVKLLASVIKKENDDYFLVTPVEKIKITVDDVPFVLTQWRWQDDKCKTMVVSTNLDDEFVLDAEHSLLVTKGGDLYVTVRRNLLAKVHRNVFYQWVDLVKEEVAEKGIELVFYSAGSRFCLGIID